MSRPRHFVCCAASLGSIALAPATVLAHAEGPYTANSLLMSLLPLTIVGGLAYFLWKRYS